MSCDSSPHLPTNHVFVDVENVKVIDPAVIGAKNLRLHLFFGPHQKKLDVEVVEKLLEHSQTVQMIRSPKSGKNALDFVLAYHLGQAVHEDPKGYFHIVSKDTGFDALVELLKSRHVKVKRHNDWKDLHFHSVAKPQVTAGATPQVSAALPEATGAKLSQNAAKLLENLRKSEKNRPKKQKTLITHAKNFGGKDKPDAEAEKVVAELQKAGHLAIDEKRTVSYTL
jgi:PIN domain